MTQCKRLKGLNFQKEILRTDHFLQRGVGWEVKPMRNNYVADLSLSWKSFGNIHSHKNSFLGGQKDPLGTIPRVSILTS